MSHVSSSFCLANAFKGSVFAFLVFASTARGAGSDRNEVLQALGSKAAETILSTPAGSDRPSLAIERVDALGTSLNSDERKISG